MIWNFLQAVTRLERHTCRPPYHHLSFCNSTENLSGVTLFQAFVAWTSIQGSLEEGSFVDLMVGNGYNSNAEFVGFRLGKSSLNVNVDYLGGGFKYFLFSPLPRGRFPIRLILFFQMGWNHQLETLTSPFWCFCSLLFFWRQRFILLDDLARMSPLDCTMYRRNCYGLHPVQI